MVIKAFLEFHRFSAQERNPEVDRLLEDVRHFVHFCEQHYDKAGSTQLVQDIVRFTR